jgi:hypothetical protein
VGSLTGLDTAGMHCCKPWYVVKGGDAFGEAASACRHTQGWGEKVGSLALGCRRLVGRSTWH